MRLLALVLGALLLTGCVAPPAVDLSPSGSRAPSPMPAELDPCGPTNITTVIADRLRVGVTEAFAEPYLFDAGPLGIQGYQADVMYALAEQFELRPSEVVWLEVAPDADPIQVEADFLLSRAGERPDLEYSPTYGSEAFALAFSPGNPFITCVTEAMDRLNEAGRFVEIEQSWLITRQ